MPRGKKRSTRRSTQPTLAAALTTLVLLMVVVIYRGLSSGPPPAWTPAPRTPQEESQPTQDWYSLYFTNPRLPAADTLRGGPDEALAAAIEAARVSIDAAVYEFNLWSIRDALLRAQQRGVQVRMVTESDNLETDEMQELVRAGIPVLGDRREGLMHNKFVVIDRQEVWTGSMNLTITDAYRNNNNLIRIRSSRLAQNYTTEFEEMFVDDRFGPTSPVNKPHPLVTVEGARIEVYFSPEDGVQKNVIELVEGARSSIYFLAYSFTSDEIASAMLARSQAGVTVSGVFENQQYRSNTGTEFENFLEAGVAVRLDGNARNMHHKVIVIDEEFVITGSYNFSFNAENRNDENLLIIQDEQIARQYLAEWQRVWAEAKP